MVCLLAVQYNERSSVTQHLMALKGVFHSLGTKRNCIELCIVTCWVYKEVEHGKCDEVVGQGSFSFHSITHNSGAVVVRYLDFRGLVSKLRKGQTCGGISKLKRSPLFHGSAWQYQSETSKNLKTIKPTTYEEREWHGTAFVGLCFPKALFKRMGKKQNSHHKMNLANGDFYKAIEFSVLWNDLY